MRRHPHDQPEHVTRLARRALPEVLLPERAQQRLVAVLDQLGRAADVYGLVRVLGVEDCQADPWVLGEIPGLLARRRREKSTKSPSLTIQTTEVCCPPSGFSVATVATFLPSSSLRVSWSNLTATASPFCSATLSSPFTRNRCVLNRAALDSITA